MDSTNKGKAFDAGAMMRSIRCQLADELDKMSVEEEIRWLRTRESEDPVLGKLIRRIAQSSDAAEGASHRT